MNNNEKINVKENGEEVTVSELAKIWNLTLRETVSCICNCDHLYGYICDYHMNPSIKKPIGKWQDLVDDATFYYEPEKFPAKRRKNNISAIEK